MSPLLASVLCLAFIGWLFYRDYRRKERVSGALWIPLLWVLILGSRPISMWFGVDAANSSAEALSDGSPLDRLLFLLLIVAAGVVLAARRLHWGGLVRSNRWLFVFFLYLGISVLWSDYPFVSFKRWVKDVGNLLMVLVVLSEKDPSNAGRVLLARSCYLLIPLSELLTKYFPDISRGYDHWSGKVSYLGVTTDKNLLGMTLCACGIGLLWSYFAFRDNATMGRTWVDYLKFMFLGVMEISLIQKADSSTSLVCTILGGGIIFSMQFSSIRRRLQQIGTITVGAIVALVFLHWAFDLGGVVARMLGRDLTLTGRTEIWDAVLNERSNPLFGEGYYSFWTGARQERLSAQYHYELNEAHNGYLETYLNSGLIGLSLLGTTLCTAWTRIKRAAGEGGLLGVVRLACFSVAIFYAMTEAVFDRLSLIWFLLLFAIVEYPRLYECRAQAESAMRSSCRPSESKPDAAVFLRGKSDVDVDAHRNGFLGSLGTPMKRI